MILLLGPIVMLMSSIDKYYKDILEAVLLKIYYHKFCLIQINVMNPCRSKALLLIIGIFSTK